MSNASDNRRQDRVTRAQQEAKRRERATLLGDDIVAGMDVGLSLDMRMQTAMAGVTLTWLHYVFKRDRNTAKILLRDCPVLRHGAGGAPIYDPAVAAQYLVKPKLDIAALLGTLKESDLPDDLKPKVWEARLKRQRWEEKAGNLWRGEVVLETFGETFKRMKETMQLWADDIAELTTLTDKQRTVISDKVNDLQGDIHKTLLDMAANRRSPSTKDEDAPLVELDEED